MDDLVAWLTAQIRQDEDWLHAAVQYAGHTWHCPTNGIVETADDQFSTNDRGVSHHIVSWDPARAQLECTAKLSILQRHVITVTHQRELPTPESPAGRPFVDVNCAICGWVSTDGRDACPTLHDLARPYATRPGFRPEWGPVDG